MKNLLLLVSLLAFLSACRPEDPPLPPDPPDEPNHLIELGKVSMIRDGAAWKPSCTASLIWDSLIVIKTENVVSNIGVVEKFRIADIPCRAGIFKVEQGTNTNWGNSLAQASFGWTLDGDQFLGQLNTHSENITDFVEIIEYNEQARTVEGRFSLHLKDYDNTISPNPFWPPPDSVTLTEGVFYLKIEE